MPTDQPPATPPPACLPAASFPLTQRTLDAEASSDSEGEGEAAAAAARVGPQLQARLAVQAKQVVRLEDLVLDQAQRITQVGWLVGWVQQSASTSPPARPPACCRAICFPPIRYPCWHRACHAPRQAAK